MTIFQTLQEEVLGCSGHQDWTKIILRDFGDGQIEAVSMPYETWSEPGDEVRRCGKRGEGDRDESVKRSARRARTKVRYLCKALKARYLLTLTTKAVITDVAEFQKLFQEFVRRIRRVASFQTAGASEAGN